MMKAAALLLISACIFFHVQSKGVYVGYKGTFPNGDVYDAIAKANLEKGELEEISIGNEFTSEFSSYRTLAGNTASGGNYLYYTSIQHVITQIDVESGKSHTIHTQPIEDLKFILPVNTGDFGDYFLIGSSFKGELELIAVSATRKEPDVIFSTEFFNTSALQVFTVAADEATNMFYFLLQSGKLMTVKYIDPDHLEVESIQDLSKACTTDEDLFANPTNIFFNHITGKIVFLLHVLPKNNSIENAYTTAGQASPSDVMKTCKRSGGKYNTSAIQYSYDHSTNTIYGTEFAFAAGSHKIVSFNVDTGKQASYNFPDKEVQHVWVL